MEEQCDQEMMLAVLSGQRQKGDDIRQRCVYVLWRSEALSAIRLRQQSVRKAIPQELYSGRGYHLCQGLS